MLGLFSTLQLGARALQTAQMGVEVTGHNLANVNNPDYARQRLLIQTNIPLLSQVGPQGTGAIAVAIQQLRSELIDGQVRSEQSVGGYWTAQQSALQYAQTWLGEFLDRNADNVDGAVVAGGAGGSQGLASEISGLFNAFQSVATSPTSLSERQALISQAQSLAARFNEIATHLVDLRAALNASLDSDVNSANQLLSDIAGLNEQIARAELSGGTANDLRDLREQKLEALAKRVDLQTGTGADGSINVTISGTQMVSGNQVLDTLQTYDAGGQILVRTATSATPLTLTGGSMQGTIDARDGALQDLRNSLDALASTLIAQVNSVHGAGFGLTDTTGAAFFTGTDAANMGVNAALVDDPSLIQASGVPGEHGNNSVALALAQLAQQANGALNNQTFSAAYGQIVGEFGSALQNANNQSSNHVAVNSLLLQQRDSVSGVSIDEEMTNLIIYQRAYQAAAKVVTTVDTMIETVLGMKR